MNPFNQKSGLPLAVSPLIHCMTNAVTIESVANAILYIDGKPIMTEDPRDFTDLYEQVNGTLINLGHLSDKKERQMMDALAHAKEKSVPVVVDIVGAPASRVRLSFSRYLLSLNVSVIKGNTSEMRTLCGLVSRGKGVDGHKDDQETKALTELLVKLKELSLDYPTTCFLATGKTDCIAYQGQAYTLNNGIEELDRFTGSGDMVGALITTLLGSGFPVLDSVIQAVSYFNLCGEKGATLVDAEKGVHCVRHQLLNQLSLLMLDDNWQTGIRGERA